MYMSPKLSEDFDMPKPTPKAPPPPPSKCHWTDQKCNAANPRPQPTPAPKIKMPPKVPGDSEAEAIARIQRTYRDVYKCKDDLADSRQTCKIKASLPDYDYVPCDKYMNLPNWPDVGGAAATLSNFPNNMADRISRELDWYNAIIKQLSDALEMGKNPPNGPPDSKNSPSKDSSGKSWSADGKVEGFEDSAKCSPSAMQARLERERRAKLQSKQSKPDPADDPDSCIMPDLASEIRRVNSILSSPQMSNSLSQANGLLGAMKQLQISQQKAKDGTLYAWQQDGPKKSYTSFKGGDRLAALLFSMRQNN
jgi:hypothetical protein